jgi:cytochrome c-type biogenesis protein CcmH/NrfF
LLARLQRSNLKLAAAFFIALASLLAQDITNYLTPDVARVGMRLACQCGGCKNTVGDCPMLHCGSADPKRRRIFEMKQRGVSDDEIVNTFVREEGVVALSGPLHHELFVWLMPGIALLIGFFIYTAYVRRNRKAPAPLTPVDKALIDRFQNQIDRELGDSKK